MFCLKYVPCYTNNYCRNFFARNPCYMNPCYKGIYCILFPRSINWETKGREPKRFRKWTRILENSRSAAWCSKRIAAPSVVTGSSRWIDHLLKKCISLKLNFYIFIIIIVRIIFIFLIWNNVNPCKLKMANTMTSVDNCSRYRETTHSLTVGHEAIDFERNAVLQKDGINRSYANIRE